MARVPSISGTAQFVPRHRSREAEGLGAKLNHLLLGFLEAEVLPPAMRAAELGLDPTPWLEVVTGVFRLYADALERPERDDS